ncbi:hypothetical protein E5163_11275 [Marinicauda algicola]|uniref:Tetratricopeptide repeat protein n=1 Tax=Marinicauda algicola TaxID=2029849 RepID=A0A4S2GZY4_9PROT|nr:hypothetical protein [Marinicauda algicola]TGY88392.1 hypothetical protein E5163_11275 [Marinicauda algicola]
MKNLASAVLAGALACTPLANADDSSPSQGVLTADSEVWIATVRQTVDTIRSRHPDPFSKVGELTFMRAADRLLHDIPRLSPEERAVRLMQLVAMLADGHTRLELIDPAYARWYPIRIREYADGYFITSAHESVAELAGAEVLEIGDRPAGEVIDLARSLMGADNAMDETERMYAVHNAFLMEGLGVAVPGEALRFRLRLRGGRVVDRALEPHAGEARYGEGAPVFDWHYYAEVYGLPIGSHEDWVAAFGTTPSEAFLTADETRPPFWGHRARYYRRYIPEHDTLYLQLNQTDDTTFVAYIREALEIADRERPAHFVIDMRNNFGGDGSIAGEMIREFIRRGPETPWENLYVVTGPKTFSAAMAILAQFAEHTDASFIGEPAGAAWNSYGDAEAHPLPGIGASLSVSEVRHQLSRSNDRSAFTPVDVPAVWRFSDYLAGRDPALDPILEGRDMRSIANIALEEGGEAARRAYLARLDEARSLDWWAPPEEIVLRRVCDRLLRQERFADAVETCRLNSEIHPYIWNTWYNLGLTLRASGMEQEGLSALRCVVELAPTNWNVPAILNLYDRVGVHRADLELPAGCPAR